MENQEIKKRIREIRESLGYTQDYMARSLQISLNSYCQIETGKTKLISNRAVEIARLLNTTVKNIITGDVDPSGKEDNSEEREKVYRENISRIESDHRIKVIELEDEIQRLKMALESKESIIGVLKESLNNYRK